MHYAKLKWQEKLEQFSNRVLEIAKNEMMEQTDYPPTLAKMINHCRLVKKRMVIPVEPDIKVASKEVAQAHIKQMYKYLSIKKEI